jgi:hypothetical protein
LSPSVQRHCLPLIVPFQTPSSAFGNMFSPKPVAESTGAKPVEDKPFKPMFGSPIFDGAGDAPNIDPNCGVFAGTGVCSSLVTFGAAFGNMFSPKPVAESTGAKPVEDKPFKPMFGTPVAGSAKTLFAADCSFPATGVPNMGLNGLSSTGFAPVLSGRLLRRRRLEKGRQPSRHLAIHLRTCQARTRLAHCLPLIVPFQPQVFQTWA